MRLKIAARKSDLARLQAYLVGKVLTQKYKDEGTEVDFFFRESLGDKNLNDPLWKMPEKGVFTEDFIEGLVRGEFDMVVHSWKDLPTEARKHTEIVATLPRADMRDILIFPKKFKEQVESTKQLQVFSSSPRREYNLLSFLNLAWPHKLDKIQFHPVRGNVQTRVKKCVESDGKALIVAKAALDRLLESTEEEFQETRSFLRKILDQCFWMVLPLTVNPPAAAQGALAIEIAKNPRISNLKSLLLEINCEKTFSAVQWERQTLTSFGGGCHQKIGVVEASHLRGQLRVLRGITQDGEKLERTQFLDKKFLDKKKEAMGNSAKKLWSAKLANVQIFKEQMIWNSDVAEKMKGAEALYVAKSVALPNDYNVKQDQLIWCAGLESWKKLAERGVWVSGCDESLGEQHPNIDNLMGRKIQWLKLTHQAGYQCVCQGVHQNGLDGLSILPTYRLVPTNQVLNQEFRLDEFTHFFWTSYSQFDFCLNKFPEIAKAHHGCGLGHTAELIEKKIGAPVKVFLGEMDWKKCYQEAHL